MRLLGVQGEGGQQGRFHGRWHMLWVVCGANMAGELSKMEHKLLKLSK